VHGFGDHKKVKRTEGEAYRLVEDAGLTPAQLACFPGA
jgi:hypothetical protein